jgi:hypothetical protein
MFDLVGGYLATWIRFCRNLKLDQDSFFFPQTGGWLLGFPQLGFSKKSLHPWRVFCAHHRSILRSITLGHLMGPRPSSSGSRWVIATMISESWALEIPQTGKLVVVVRGFCDFGSFWCYYSVSEICSCWFFKARSEASFKSFLGTSTFELFFFFFL